MRNFNTSGLNPKQAEIWSMVRAQSGVVMLKGKAGVAKSATCKGIADNVIIDGEPLQFLDLRLSQMDETHFGFPYRKPRENAKSGDTTEVMHYALPRWFEEACKRPTLINFEELNRCSQDVQNAALEILNERTLHGRKLPDHVYMIATGNMGEEDGCSVQEFDNALINRLILIDFDMTFPEWCEYYANDNVTDLIISFLKEHTQHYYTATDKIEMGKPFATPRSWTNLSRLIEDLDSIEEIKDMVEEFGFSFVGTSATVSFVTWLNEALTISLTEVLAGTDKVGKLSRSEINKIIQDIERDYLTVEKLNVKQIYNLVKFFEPVEQDLVTSYISKVFTSDNADSDVPGFEPCQEITPNTSDNIENTIKIISEAAPDYELTKTYAYLKHPIFHKAIVAFKTGYVPQES
jgi:MoxR-like ATPase